MSFGNNRLKPQQLYSAQPPNFVPWSQQANPMFNFASQFSPMASHPPILFSSSFLIQQQNNYYNSPLLSNNFNMPNTTSPIIPHNLNPYFNWQPRPMPVKNLADFFQKPKSNPKVICLDQESVENVVVIEDSQDGQPVQLIPKKDEKLKSEIQKSQLRLQHDRQIKQKDFSYEVKKKQFDLPQKRQNRNAKYCTVTEINKKETDSKLQKKKLISKDRFLYKLTPHQKYLSELSQYRYFFPHQTVTGPQYQAKLPHLRLFKNSFGGLWQSNSWLCIRRQKLLNRLQSSQLK